MGETDLGGIIKVMELSRRDFLKSLSMVGGFIAVGGVGAVVDILKESIKVPKHFLVQTFEGRRASGKTTVAVAYTYYVAKTEGRTIYTDLHLNIPYKKLDLEALRGVQDAAILVDNSFVTFDERAYNKQIEYASSLLLSARENNTIISVVVPHLDYLDKRIRRLVSIRNVCNLEGKHLHLRSLDRSTATVTREDVLDIRPYWELFDTRQVMRRI